jgi:hypothetical protein
VEPERNVFPVMTENEKLCAMFADGLIEREEVPPSCWRRPRKHRKPKPLSLAIAIKKAKAKGMDLTVEPSGSMTFKSVPDVKNTQGSELDQWLAKQHAH